MAILRVILLFPILLLQLTLTQEPPDELAIPDGADGGQRCPPNEIYLTCGICEGSCTNPNPWCSGCKPPGCYCPQGYVRDAARRCVPASQCYQSTPGVTQSPKPSQSPRPTPTPSPRPGSTPRCPRYEIWKECGCEGSCNDHEPLCNKGDCKPGCYCEKGYVRYEGECIYHTNCPPYGTTERPRSTTPQCPDNEVYMDCGSCEASCDDPHPICTEECRPPGCYCPKDAGFVRFGRRCIPVSQCPPRSTTPPASTPRCPRPEIWKDCGCDGSCDDPDGDCDGRCRPGCFCPDGYVRDASGRCIPEWECPPHSTPFTPRTRPTRPTKKPTTPLSECTTAAPPTPRCPRNEVWLRCGTCEGSCDDPNPICTKDCKPPGCYCPAKDGYVRDCFGKCIKFSQCDQHKSTTPFTPTTRKCGEHEHWTDCGGCDVFCENPNPFCTLQCRRKCECDTGYVRGWDGKCIKKSECTLHPECAHTTCPRYHKCVWKPNEKCPTCPQVACVPI